MKSKISIALISLALLSVTKTWSCGDISDIPANYYMFRIYDNTDDKDNVEQNCELWQKQTSATISLEDIQRAVYKMSHEDWQRVLLLIEQSETKDTLMHNQFVSWIVEHKDIEVVNFLSLAKQCEETRWQVNSPWYYPTDGDDVSQTLTKIAERAKSYRGNRLRDRYALQAIRALFSTSQYGEVINFWNNNQRQISDGLMKDMIQPYLAGAYFRTGSVERAMRIYAECGDIQSLLFCTGKQGKKVDEIEMMDIVYTLAPNSSALAQTMHNMIRKYEHYRTDEDWDKYLRLYDFALKVIAEERVCEPAMWLYTAAFIADMKGDFQLASKFLAKAATTPSSQFIKESVKVLQIYVDAKLYPYNAAYEQLLFGQLQWLDDKIRNNIDESVKEKTAVLEFSRNLSYYYWNDMLRKIALSVLVPRYIEQGNPVRAIQLANMADNRLLGLLDGIYMWSGKTLTEMRQSTKEWNWIDYSNDLFYLVDSVGVDNVIAYTQRLRQPRSRFDRFLNERGYTNLVYFKEIIGTQCLREMRYADAVSYLSQVPPSFQYTLNTVKDLSHHNAGQDNCMKRDPFAIDCFHSRIADKSDYKYNFAREMVSLEQSMKQTKDPNRKAQLQIRYAVGIRNSINDAWALTQYYLYDVDYPGHWKYNENWKRANIRSKTLINEAFKMFTDAESAAQGYLYLGSGKQIMELYPTTHTAEILSGHCDNLADYSYAWK